MVASLVSRRSQKVQGARDDRPPRRVTLREPDLLCRDWASGEGYEYSTFAFLDPGPLSDGAIDIVLKEREGD